MARKLWLTRDRYGQVQSATFDRPVHRKYKEEHSYDRSGVREVRTYKDLVYAFMTLGTSGALFNAAWRLANRDGALYDLSEQKPTLARLHHFLEEAGSDAQTVEDYAGQLVNDPGSRFHLYG